MNGYTRSAAVLARYTETDIEHCGATDPEPCSSTDPEHCPGTVAVRERRHYADKSQHKRYDYRSVCDGAVAFA